MIKPCVVLFACLAMTVHGLVRSPARPQALNFRVDFDGEPEPQRRHNKAALRVRNEYGVQYTVANSLRIRGGNASDGLNFPYMAAVMINGRLWCAGAIIDVGWVLTAAHCLNYVLHVSPMQTLSRYVKVRVGSVKPHEGGELMDVVGAVRHPKFEEEPVPHADVALLKLARNLVFSNYVNLIRIHDSMRQPYAQSFIVVAGWGATRGTDTSFRDHTPDLLNARLKVRSRHYCADAYQLVNGFQFTEDFFCASLRNGTRDACLFDAGAPAVQNNDLMGVMSFGPERCGQAQPAVFIKAFYFRPLGLFYMSESTSASESDICREETPQETQQDFVKTTVASYKSTGELIEAMNDVDGTISPPIKYVEPVSD